jgi:hypothetical protein
MKRISTIFACAWLASVFCVNGAVTLEMPNSGQRQEVFFGAKREIVLTIHNAGAHDFGGDIRARMFQTSSSTAVLLGDRSWKKLRLLSRQTIVESAALDFPEVKAETKFLVQWVGQGNQVIGTTEVWVYPTNLLAELKPLVGDEAIGVYDPLNQLKPSLHRMREEFTDLENTDLETFSGKLAIFGPFTSSEQMTSRLVEEIKAMGKRNIAVVWLLPPQKMREKLMPSFYALPEKQVATVVVQSNMVLNLRENPRAQLNLVQFCKMALAPELFVLSTFNRTEP